MLTSCNSINQIKYNKLLPNVGSYHKRKHKHKHKKHKRKKEHHSATEDSLESKGREVKLKIKLGGQTLTTTHAQLVIT